MDRSVDKKKIITIVCICLMCFAVIGGTVAFYVKILFTVDTDDVITYGLDYYINYSNGTNVVGTTLDPTMSYADSPSSDIKFWKKDDTYDIYGHIYLDINSMSDVLSDSGALKYTIINNNKIISEGVITNNESSLLLSSNIPLKTSEQIYRIHIWLDDSMSLDSQISNETLDLEVRCEATMKKVNVLKGFAKYITNLYTSNNPTEIIQYQKDGETEQARYYYSYMDEDNTWGLMNDGLGNTVTDTNALINGTEGNIRYYGANPNNYIDIGDRNSSGNVILYRVIGLFKDVELEDGTRQDLIKVRRNSAIGSFSWDNKPNGFGSSNSASGSNDWSDARLMMLLNPGYENGALDSKGNNIYAYEGSLWWNSKSGTCYSGKDNATKSCDFTSTGLSPVARQKVETVTWNLGGSANSYLYVDQYYKVERGTSVYSGRPTEWTGKVALMYPSDYGYAADLSLCKQQLFSYGDSNCYGTNWLYITKYYQWPLMVHSGNSTGSRRLDQGGFIGNNDSVYTALSIFPTFYLNSELDIVSGDGTKDRPFVLDWKY